LYVGSDQACHDGTAERAVVHACKRPCYREAMGRAGTLPHDHPDRHFIEEEYDLYLNILDRMQPRFSMEVFEAFFAFATTHWRDGRDLLVHCNAGRSRSPSLALLFLAGVTGDLRRGDFVDAAKDYAAVDPDGRPGPGLRRYLREHWEELMAAADAAGEETA
jgi:hypothetical protein